jgi:hypothetical protein
MTAKAMGRSGLKAMLDGVEECVPQLENVLLPQETVTTS